MIFRPTTMVIGVLTIAVVAATASARISYADLKNTRANLAVAQQEARDAANQMGAIQEALQREVDARRRIQAELTSARAMLAEAARTDPEYQEWRNQPLPAAAIEVLSQ